MNNKIDVSVIIPVYNAEKTICECVDSVVNEMLANGLSYEVILVDDGSTDNSLALCRQYAETNPCINVIAQKNSGPSVARNTGIKNASGEFIALNDADDKWLSGKMKIQIEELRKNTEVDLVCAKYGSCRRAGKRTDITYKKEMFHNFFSPQTSVFRLSALVCGFNETLSYSEDMRFLLDFMQHGKCVYLPFLATVPVLSKCVFGEAGLSSHIWKMEIGELKNILFAKKIHKINILVMLIAMLWSLLKSFRRAAISVFIKIRKIFRRK